MKRFLFFLFSLIAVCQHAFSAVEQSPEKIISLITTSPFDEEIYTAWGHTAVRVRIPAEDADIIFNYGIFAFDDGFLYKFVKGETDYQLDYWRFRRSLAEANRKNIFMYEQVLNLTNAEKETLYAALLENTKEENKYYRYSFFFDNCATRPLWKIEEAVDGKINFPVFNNTYTFRDLIYQKLENNSPWFAFGIDLALGSETDRVVTDRELLFLPEELMRSFAESSIQAGDSIRPLISETHILNYPEKTMSLDGFITDAFTPSVVCWLLFVLIVAHTIFYNYKKKKDLWLDVILFFAYGLLGCLVFFLAFISEHPCTNPNYNLLWVNPLQLVFAVLALFRGLRKTLIFYQMLNILLLSVALFGWSFIPQQYNSAFFPLILILIIRSVNYIYHYRK